MSASEAVESERTLVEQDLALFDIVRRENDEDCAITLSCKKGEG